MFSSHIKRGRIRQALVAAASGLAMFGLLLTPVGAEQPAQESKGSSGGSVPTVPLAVTEMVSLADNEAQGNNASGIEGIRTGVSADGRFVAFYSFASNLVPGDTNGHPDVFLRDRQEGTTTLISRGYDGSPANGLSLDPSISADGNYIAYLSDAENIVQGDGDGSADAFVYNRLTGQNSIIGQDSFGTEAPFISGNGRFVVFHTYASLVPEDTQGARDVYVTDLVSGGFELISKNALNQVGSNHSFDPYISFDGRYVAFHSLADNLVPGDGNMNFDVFVRDRTENTIVLASTGSGGVQGNNRSVEASVSDDGRYVAFESLASNLVVNDTNDSLDIFVRDLTDSTMRVSVDSAGVQGTGHSTDPNISGNGRYVVFQSNARLAPTDPNIVTDIYSRDLQANTTEQISLTSSGQPGLGYSHKPQVSSDGRYVVFGSYASNLVPGDNNDTRDVFLRDRVSEACVLHFSDVPSGSTFHPFVMCLACRSIISGYTDGTFRPNNQVTRGQLSKIVSNAAGYSESHANQTFQDVPPGSTFHQFVERLSSRNIISGYPCGAPGEECVPPQNRPYFRPNAYVTRVQTSKIAAIAANLPVPPSEQHTFEDVPPGSTFWTWVEGLASSGAIGGYPCGGPGEECVPPQNRPYFRSNAYVTRGQSAKIVANTFFPNCQIR
ncbi:MAG: S-layer homology domain-containing protein [Chloroflexia bacterium]